MITAFIFVLALVLAIGSGVVLLAARWLHLDGQLSMPSDAPALLLDLCIFLISIYTLWSIINE